MPPSSRRAAFKSFVAAAVVVAATTASSAVAQNVANGNSGIVPPHLRGDSVVPHGNAIAPQRAADNHKPQAIAVEPRGESGKKNDDVIAIERPIVVPKPVDAAEAAGNGGDDLAVKNKGKEGGEKDQLVHILPYPYPPVYNNNNNNNGGSQKENEGAAPDEALADWEDLEEQEAARESIADVVEEKSSSSKREQEQQRPDIFKNIIEGEDDEEIFADVEASIHADTIGSIMLPPPRLKAKRDKKKKSLSNSNSNSNSNSKLDAEGDEGEDDDESEEEKRSVRRKGWHRRMRKGQNGKLRHHSKSLTSPMLLFDGEKFVANIDDDGDEAEKLGKWRAWRGRKHRRHHRRDAAEDEEEKNADAIAQLEHDDGQEIGIFDDENSLSFNNGDEAANPEGREERRGAEEEDKTDRRSRRGRHKNHKNKKNQKRRGGPEREGAADGGEASDALFGGSQEHDEENVGGPDGRLEAKHPHKKDKDKNERKKKKSESKSNDFISKVVGKISKFLGIGESASGSANNVVVEAERPHHESVLLRDRAMSPQRKMGGKGENKLAIPPPPLGVGAQVEGQGLARGKRAGLAPWILDKDPQKPAPDVAVFTSSPNPNALDQAAEQNAVVEDASIPLAVLSDPDDREEAGDEPNVAPLPFFPPRDDQKRGHGRLVSFGNDPDQEGGRHGGVPNRRGRGI